MSEELSFQEVEELLEGVINNKKLTEIQTLEGLEYVVFSHPSAQEILASRYTRRTALIEAAKEELPSREDIDRVIEERGIGGEDKKKIGDLENQIKAQDRLLSLTKIEARRKPILENISRMNEEIEELQAKNESMYALTQEFRADEEALLYLSWAGAYKITGEKYWPSFEAFEKDTDLIRRSSLVQGFALFNRGLDITQIRFLARHVLWRIRYTAGLKIGGPLFPQGLCDLTTDQQSLLYWSNYYQSIYEMMPDEQPDQDIIDDDKELDAYMESYFKRREQEGNDGRLKRRSGGKGKLSAESSAEVIVTTNHPDYLKMSYSEERIKSSEEASEVEVISPTSKRARNRRGASKNR